MIARLLISKSLNSRLFEIEKILSQAGISRNHPDLLYFPTGDKLGIEQARIIKKHFSLKPYQAVGQVVILEDASTLTPEAQNAMLKILEEPPANAILILGASSDAKFLPTILSRCQVIRLQPTAGPRREGEQKTDYFKEIEKLLSANIEERLEYIEKNKKREELLQSLLSYFHQNLRSSSFLKELLQAEEWENQNVNIRAILEYLILKMPASSRGEASK